MKITNSYKGKLQSIIRGVEGLFGDNVKSYTKLTKVLSNLGQIAGLKSTARRVGGVFKFTKGTQFVSATMQGNPFISLIKFDAKANIKNGFVHNIFGFGYIGYAITVIKNGMIMRDDFFHPIVDTMDTAMKVDVYDNGEMHVSDADIVDCVPANVDRYIIVNKVKTVINGAKVIATFERNINRCKIKKGYASKNNSKISQVLHSPKVII